MDNIDIYSIQYRHRDGIDSIDNIYPTDSIYNVDSISDETQMVHSQCGCMLLRASACYYSVARAADEVGVAANTSNELGWKIFSCLSGSSPAII